MAVYQFLRHQRSSAANSGACALRRQILAAYADLQTADTRGGQLRYLRLLVDLVSSQPAKAVLPIGASKLTAIIETRP